MTSRRRRPACALLLGPVLVALAGCAFAADPVQVGERADAVYRELLTALSETDPAVLRTVEELPIEEVACAADDRTQQARVMRGTLSVQAAEGAGSGIADEIAARLDDGWTRALPTDDADESQDRSWSSAEGITVTVSDASPTIVVAVFTPCA